MFKRYLPFFHYIMLYLLTKDLIAAVYNFLVLASITLYFAFILTFGDSKVMGQPFLQQMPEFGCSYVVHK
jgi:hypothetical protein